MVESLKGIRAKRNKAIIIVGIRSPSFQNGVPLVLVKWFVELDCLIPLWTTLNIRTLGNLRT